MRWYRFDTDFFACDCEKRKMYWMYIEFFGKKQAGKDVPKMCRRINQRFLRQKTIFPLTMGISCATMSLLMNVSVFQKHS